MDVCGQCQVYVSAGLLFFYIWLEFVTYGLSVKIQQLMHITCVKCWFCNLKIVGKEVFCRVMLLGKTSGATAQRHILQGDAVG